MSDGLVRAISIQASGINTEVDWNFVRAWTPAQGLLWVHLDASADGTSRWLDSNQDLPDIATAAILAPESRPRVDTIGDGAMIVLRGVNFNPGSNPEDMVSIRLWVDDHRIISTRFNHIMSVVDVAEALQHTAIEGTGNIVVMLIERLVERMANVIDEVDEQVAKLEEAALVEPKATMRAALARLRREAIALRRYLAPQREALGKLQVESLSWLSDMDRMRLREVYDRLVRHIEDLDAVRERAAVVQEEIISHLSDQLNQRMYILSIVAAVFLPLGFLTGLLGVNLGGIPGSESGNGFAVFMFFLLVIVALQLWYFIRRKWF